MAPELSGEEYERRNPADPDDARDGSRSGAADADPRSPRPDAAAADGLQIPAPARGRFLAGGPSARGARRGGRGADDPRDGQADLASRAARPRGVAILDFFAGEGLRPLGEVFEQSATGNLGLDAPAPVGVVGLITPWNFPRPSRSEGGAWPSPTATRSCSLVVDSPGTGLLAECFAEAGLPVPDYGSARPSAGASSPTRGWRDLVSSARRSGVRPGDAAPAGPAAELAAARTRLIAAAEDA